jgi:hypothetical protein
MTKTRSNRIVETVDVFPHKFTLPFPSSHELATQAAADLTHALLNPQPAGPLCQGGDEQAIALRKLANLFGSVKPKNDNNTLAPQDETDNNAPQRVQTTASPPRVAGQDQGQTSLKHIIPSQLTPNSHRRQKNTSQTNSHTTNTSWYGETECKTTKFVSRYDGRNNIPGKSLFFYFIPNQIHSPIKYKY